MGEIDEAIHEAMESGAASGLHSLIAMLVAITATVMALANIKGQNIVQRMDAAQIERVDQWTLYQAKSTKQNLAEGIQHQLQLALVTNPALSSEQRQELEQQRAHYAAEVERYQQEKVEIKAKAEAAEEEYRSLGVYDDQLDVGEACFTVSIALYGVAALTKKKPLLALGILFSSAGLVLAIAAFAHRPISLGTLGAFLG